MNIITNILKLFIASVQKRSWFLYIDFVSHSLAELICYFQFFFFFFFVCVCVCEFFRIFCIQGVVICK